MRWGVAALSAALLLTGCTNPLRSSSTATSFQLMRFAQRERNQAKLVVTRCLPLAHGTFSTTTALHVAQEIRRIAPSAPTLPLAGRAHALAALRWPDLDVELLLRPHQHELDPLVHEALVFLDGIEQSLDQHRAPFLGR